MPNCVRVVSVMAAAPTPESRHPHGDFKNAPRVLLSVAVGLGLILVLAIVLAFEKCAAGYTALREKFRRPSTAAAPVVSIDNPVRRVAETR